MTAPLTGAPTHPRRRGRSVFAVFLGFIAVVILSLGTDQILHVLKVYPPWGVPMWEPSLNALALSYRIVYTIAGGYIAARFAPYAPMRHAVALGIVGLIPGFAGAIYAVTKSNLGPSWYPIALAIVGLPCCWIGGALYQARHPER
jgi:4-amino-4-deoxy-L-arabinose transferase-like glycosyltransferase